MRRLGMLPAGWARGDRGEGRFHSLRYVAAAACALVLAAIVAPAAFGQSLAKDNGNCATASGRTVFACWNVQAGSELPEQLGDYPEFLPFLEGWDFRINLPHVRFQQAGSGAGSLAAMVGVVEDGTPVANKSGTLRRYGHRNNAIWIFRVAQGDRRLYAKALPSRRALDGSASENVASLTAGWTRIGAADSPALRVEKPAAAVVGEGVGAATVYLVARRESDGALLFGERSLSSVSPSWSIALTPVGAVSSTRASLVAAFDGRLALAWRDPTAETVKVRLYTPSAGDWGPVVEVPGPAAGEPQLVWDGTALDLFYVAKETKRLRHLIAAGTALAFGDAVDVAPSPVLSNAFNALAWNGRLHVGFVPENGALDINYTVSTVPYATRSEWVPPVNIGVQTVRALQLVAFADTLFAVGVGGGKVRYARRDPNRPGPETSGVNSAGLWLSRGQLVDQDAAGFFTGGVEALSFNQDVYLAAHTQTGDGAGFGLRLVNLSRAAFKQLATGKWGVALRWGGLGGSAITDADGDRLDFARGDEIPQLGDFDGDGVDDVVKFTQKSEDGFGPAPVYVARGGVWRPQRWHTFFSLKGEIPLVGDFNGDGKDDIVSFVQKEQRYANGQPIGPAPVWVSLSNGTKFTTSRIWHTYFSLEGEIPQVGDFNGDGKDDIVSFVQKEQRYADGSLLGHAPVWVSLSNGTTFGGSRVWHTFFSLKGEVPLVGDFNLDGRDDVVTFIHDRVSDTRARNVFVALSDASRFGRSSTWMSDFAGKDTVPAVGNFGGRLGQVTDRPEDADKRTADLVAFDLTNGRVYSAASTRNVPYAAGAPWERYKWFTDKSLGLAAFPEWIWQRPNHCIGNPHSLVLLGAAGSGGATVTNLSVRMGSRAGHVLEEFGHSIFANCFRNMSDPMYRGIYTDVGIDANSLWGGGPMSSVDCAGGTSAEQVTRLPPAIDTDPFGFYDCRDDVAEHYFLALLIHYRLDGDEFRSLIRTTTNEARRTRLTRQYNWFRDEWFGGAEFKRSAPVNAGPTADGLLCLPGECTLASARALAARRAPSQEPVPPPTRACDYPCPTAIEVRTGADLVRELEEARPGTVIQVPDGIEIDLDPIDDLPGVDLPLVIGEGVTLQSTRGARRPGALLHAEEFDESPLITVGGHDATIRNLRLRGPYGGTDKTTSVVAIGVNDRYRVTIADNEVYEWPGAAVSVRGDEPGDECRPSNGFRSHRVRVANNYFHHNQRGGLGYGVVVHDGAFPRIEGNTFDWNRHAIAADGAARTGYDARYNYVLSGGSTYPTKYGGDLFPYWEQHFDMHGSDGGYGGVAGDLVEIVGNTVHGEQQYGVPFFEKTRAVYRLRGRPCAVHELRDNVLVHDDEGEAVYASDGGGGRVQMTRNRFDTDTSWDLAVGDFDRDGRDDLFQATGAAWYYSSGGEAEWRLLQSGRTETIDLLRFGDFDGDGDTDVFTAVDGEWRISRGGTQFWERVNTSAFRLGDLGFGDFNGDGRTDVFRANGTHWYLYPGGSGARQQIETSVYDLDRLRFGDFNGDGRTDVFGPALEQWSVKYGGTSDWTRLNDRLTSDLDSLVLADFDGNGRTDIAQSRPARRDPANIEWRVSWNGTGDWSRLRTVSSYWRHASLREHWVGRFDSSPGADALRYEPRGSSRAPLEGPDLVRSSGAGADYERHSRHGMR